MNKDQVTIYSKTSPLKRLLAIDTSMATLSAGLLCGGEVLALVNERGERNHSVRLVPIIQELLQSRGIAMKELDGIATGVGPGSYTGVRIGVTVAKTIAWSLRIPLFGVSSLAALAMNSVELTKSNGKGGYAWIIPLMDARRNQGYTSLFADVDKTEDQNVAGPYAERLAEDGIRGMNQWLIELGERLDRMKELGEEPPRIIRVVGDVEPFEDALLSFGERHQTELELIPSHVSAEMIGKLAQHQWRMGQTEEVHGFVPNYTQLAEAEVKLKTRLAEQAKTGERG